MKADAHTIREQRTLPGGTRIHLEIRNRRERIPAILLLPDSPEPAPAALLLHGYTSRKEVMSETLGVSLMMQGIASLAIDLPLHGERMESVNRLSVGNPLELVSRWKAALAECRFALDWMADHPRLDEGALALVGYSLGTFLGVIVASGDARVRVVVLAAGGDLPSPTRFGKLLRMVADPLRAVRRISPRPLLMVNGRWDRTITADQAQRLYDAAGEPKELRWLDAGHYLPHSATSSAAEWLRDRLHSQRQRRSG